MISWSSRMNCVPEHVSETLVLADTTGAGGMAGTANQYGCTRIPSKMQCVQGHVSPLSLVLQAIDAASTAALEAQTRVDAGRLLTMEVRARGRACLVAAA